MIDGHDFLVGLSVCRASGRYTARASFFGAPLVAEGFATLDGCMSEMSRQMATALREMSADTVVQPRREVL